MLLIWTEGLFSFCCASSSRLSVYFLHSVRFLDSSAIGWHVTKHRNYKTVMNLPLFVSDLFETLFAKCFGLYLAIIKGIMLPCVWFELCIIHALTLSCNINSCVAICGYFRLCKHRCNCILINVCSFGKVCNSYGLVSQTRTSDCL